ncbi:MAG: HAD family phosphatase [Promethearchaeia archaeon]
MEKIRAILWDLGGVIVNLDYTSFFRFIQTHSKLQLTEAKFKQILMSNYDAYHEGTISSNEFYELMNNVLKLNQIRETEFFNAFNSIIQSLNTDTIEIIKKVKRQDLTSFVLSNVNSAHWNHLLEKDWDWMPLFEDFILSYEIGVTKPDPEIYKYAIEKARCKANQILFIDDNYVNVKGAKRCEINTIFYKNQSQFQTQLKEKLGINAEI